MGGLHDLTGDFRLPMLLLAGAGLLAVALGSNGAFRPRAVRVGAAGEPAG